MRKHCDEVDRYHGWPTHSIDATAAFMESSLCTCTVCIRDYITKMESKRLKRDDDGVRDGGEGNVTACLVAPLLEEQIPGTETCSYEGFEFTAALFLISGSDGSGSFPDVCRYIPTRPHFCITRS